MSNQTPEQKTCTTCGDDTCSGYHAELRTSKQERDLLTALKAEAYFGEGKEHTHLCDRAWKEIMRLRTELQASDQAEANAFRNRDSAIEENERLREELRREKEWRLRHESSAPETREHQLEQALWAVRDHGCNECMECGVRINRLLGPKSSEKASGCQHDIQKSNHTMVLMHDLRTGHEYDSVAKCKVCGEQFIHPLHSALNGLADSGKP